MDSTRKKRFLPVARAGIKPGDFPLFSPESRARVRDMLKQKQATDSLPIMTVEITTVGKPPEVINVYRGDNRQRVGRVLAALRAESGAAPEDSIAVNQGVAWAKGDFANLLEGTAVKVEAETETPPNKSNPQDRLLPERASVGRATLPPVSSGTETDILPDGIKELRSRRRPVGAVGYLLGQKW